MTLTADQQAAIGLFCGGTVATPDSPIESCAGGVARGAERLVIPADGTEDDVNNPPRIAPRHLLGFSVGSNNLLGTEKVRLILRLTGANLANKDVLYNFLSTFSGTHFVSPRTFQAQIGVTF